MLFTMKPFGVDENTVNIPHADENVLGDLNYDLLKGLVWFDVRFA